MSLSTKHPMFDCKHSASSIGCFMVFFDVFLRSQTCLWNFAASLVFSIVLEVEDSFRTASWLSGVGTSVKPFAHNITE